MIDQNTFEQMLGAARDYTDSRKLIDKKNIDYYLRNPRGDERPNESQAISSDCFDVVESDMPSHIRTFLGGGNIMEFRANNKNNENQILEASQKTKLINRLILGQDWSFSTLYNWLLAAEIFTVSAVTYYHQETEKREIKVLEGISAAEYELFKNALEENDKIVRAEIVREEQSATQNYAGQQVVTYDVEVHIWRKASEYIVEWIKPECFYMSKGGPTLDDCSFVGHKSIYRKGDLIELGISKDVVEDLRSSWSDGDGHNRGVHSTDIIEQTIEQAIGDTEDGEATPEWYLEEVEVITACVISATKTGAPERRRVMYAGEILKDDPFDHVNYAVLSAYPLPGQVAGPSRVGVTRRSQDEKTFVQRGMFNNMAQVNKPMTAININKDTGAVNQDDVVNRRANGLVRVNGSPADSVMVMNVPSIGNECLQLIQYLDFNRAQTTGALMASQGLSKDDIYQETATRFKGITSEGGEKMEKVMRIFSETGFRKLYRGFEWLVRTYQEDQIEDEILGQQITYNPSDWLYDADCVSTVGLASADTQELIENLGVIYNTQKELRLAGSPLVDDKKLYGTLTRILKAMNVHDNSAFYNDPAKPKEVVAAENEQMRVLIAQLQQQLEQSSVNRVLRENERLKQEVEALKTQSKTSVDIAKLQEDARQFDIETAQEATKQRTDAAIRIAELEQKYNKDLEGGLDEQ